MTIPNADKDVEKLDHLFTASEDQMVQSLWKNILAVSIELNMQVSYDPAIAFFGH